MNRDDFWKHIQLLEGSTEPEALHRLEFALINLSREQIVAFDDHLNQVLDALDTPQHRAHAPGGIPRVLGRPLDDSYRYFCAAMVARGRSFYEAASRQPSDLDRVFDDPSAEALLYVAANAYESAFGAEWPQDRPLHSNQADRKFLTPSPEFLEDLEPFVDVSAALDPDLPPREMVNHQLHFQLQSTLNASRRLTRIMEEACAGEADLELFPMQVTILAGARWDLHVRGGQSGSDLRDEPSVFVMLDASDEEGWSTDEQDRVALALAAYALESLLSSQISQCPGLRGDLQALIDNAASLIPETAMSPPSG